MNMKDIGSKDMIVGIGDLAADLVIQIPAFPLQTGSIHVTRDFRLEPGGTANFLILAARLQAETAAMGSLGADMWGHEIKTILETENIHLQRVRMEGRSTTVLVMVDDHAEHAFVGYFGSGMEQGFLDDDLALIEQAAVLFTSGYSLQEEHLAQLVLHSFKQENESTRWRMFDPGPTFQGVDADLRKDILANTDILLLTEEEIPLVSEDGLEGLFAAGPQYVVLKRGGNGCAVYAADKQICDLAGHPVTVRDTSAAGDSFAAGFAVGLTRGFDMTHCAALANAVGAAKVQKIGSGRSVPTLAEVQAVISEYNIDLVL